MGVPWRVAFALQDDGFYLRSDIIWHKPNPMPESVTDRPTKAHEYIFMLTKSSRYYYDAVAVAEPQVCTDPRLIKSGLVRGRLYGYDSKEATLRKPRKHDGTDSGSDGGAIRNHSGNSLNNPNGMRNRRDVWSVTPKPYTGAHFAVFPPELPRICMLAGTSEMGCCPQCGAPLKRMVEHTRTLIQPPSAKNRQSSVSGLNSTGPRPSATTITTGWEPTCDCDAGDPVPCTVLDPFNGSGTTGAVAKRLGRNYIGIDRDETYAKYAQKRIAAVEAAPLPEFLITPAKRDEPRIPFGTVLERGLLQAGDFLYDERKRHRARVKADATLIAASQLGEVRGSIHKVGAAIQGLPACNGWTFWCFDTGSKLVPIDILRQRIRAETVGKAN